MDVKSMKSFLSGMFIALETDFGMDPEILLQLKIVSSIMPVFLPGSLQYTNGPDFALLVGMIRIRPKKSSYFWSIEAVLRTISKSQNFERSDIHAQ